MRLCASCGTACPSLFCAECEKAAVTLARKMGRCFHHPEGPNIDACQDCRNVLVDVLTQSVKRSAAQWQSANTGMYLSYDQYKIGDTVQVRLPQRFVPYGPNRLDTLHGAATIQPDGSVKVKSD